jgi:hypothetical protein
MERDQVGVYDMMGADPSAATDDVMTSLAGLDMGGPAIQEAPLLPAVAQPAQAPVTTYVPEASAATTHISTAAALAAMSLTKGPGIEKVRTLHTFSCHNLTADIFESGRSGSRD